MRPPSPFRRAASAALLTTLLSSVAVSCAPAADDESDELASQAEAMRRRGDDDDPVPDDPGTPPKDPPPPTAQSLTTLMAKYANYDMNGDGIAEINSLTPAFPNPPPFVSRPKGLVIVFVDPRLIRDDPNTTISGVEMRSWLSMYGNDIDKDGYFPYFVAADVYRGEKHQDGRTLLAMRRFLKDVYRNYSLAGTLLVGSFPEAAILRTVMVRSHPDEQTFKNSGLTVQNKDELDIGAELITPRGEIVLGDLTGNWENVYREQFYYTDYQLLPTTTAYPAAGQILDTPDYTATPHSYADVFVVDDAPPFTVNESGGQLHMIILGVDERNPEIAPEDDLEKNRIARPEILVSRLNTLHVAVVPTAPVDVDGKTSPLGPDGKPQSLRYARGAGEAWQQTKVLWMRSPQLERKLLTDYIARQHAFRLGSDRDKPFRTSAIRQLDSGLRDPGSFNSLLRGAASGFSSSLGRDDATLADYMEWLKQPAVLRGIASHSWAAGSQFGSSDAATLDNAFGGKPWNWSGEFDAAGWWVLTPSFKNNRSDAKMPFYRSLWENGMLASAGQFFTIHDGCDVTKPANFDRPYNDLNYGQADPDGSVQNAESMLFYANGLALMGRSKVFNDTPEGFAEAVKSWGNFGQGWLAYFYHDADNGDLNELGKPFNADRRTRTLQRKRSYFWNVIGDFTLKLKY
jgi:hypothetical protein